MKRSRKNGASRGKRSRATRPAYRQASRATRAVPRRKGARGRVAVVELPLGIDVSRRNGAIDWGAVADAGAAFAYVKATEGVTGQDDRFAANWQGMGAVGILRGAMHVFRPHLDPDAQAEHFAEVVGALRTGDLPPVVELEDRRGEWKRIPTPGERLERVVAFADRVRDLLGREPILRTSPAFLTRTLRRPRAIGAHPLWLVRRRTPPAAHWSFWQFSDAGTIAGVRGKVGLLRFADSVAELQALAGLPRVAGDAPLHARHGAGDFTPAAAGAPATSRGAYGPPSSDRFQLSSDVLERLFVLNQFALPQGRDMAFVGLRGCVPVHPDQTTFGASREVIAVQPNYVNPMCTIVQWRRWARDLAVFPGSTVPYRAYVQEAAGGGAAANELMTGLLSSYQKGPHPLTGDTSHPAFRQAGEWPHRRTSDDVVYEAEDPFYVATPNDNLHAAWCASVTDGSFSSRGCQVIVGKPRCTARPSPDLGPWKQFRDQAYAISQERFAYALLSGRDAAEAAARRVGGAPPRLRFGSRGPLVEQVQRALAARGHPVGTLDGIFGKATLQAVIAFQRVALGPAEADGIVGEKTAAKLGVEWRPV